MGINNSFLLSTVTYSSKIVFSENTFPSSLVAWKGREETKEQNSDDCHTQDTMSASEFLPPIDYLSHC